MLLCYLIQIVNGTSARSSHFRKIRFHLEEKSICPSVTKLIARDDVPVPVAGVSIQIKSGISMQINKYHKKSSNYFTIL